MRTTTPCSNDVVAALEYYRLAAETGEPSALYHYGIVLLKVSYFIIILIVIKTSHYMDIFKIIDLKMLEIQF